MERNILSWLAILRDLAPTIAAYRKLTAQQRKDPAQLLPLVDALLGVLDKNAVTMSEVRDLLKNGGPLLAGFL